MSEHRRKPPQPHGGGRAAARRGTSGTPSGHRAEPRGPEPSGTAGAAATPYGSGAQGSPQEPYQGRAAARKAAKNAGRGKRRGAEAGGGAAGGAAGGAGRGGPGGPSGPGGPGRGRGRGGPPPKKRFIDYPRAGKQGYKRWVPSWKLVTGTFLGFMAGLMTAAGIAYSMVEIPKAKDAAQAENNVFYWDDNTQMAATGGETNRQIVGFEEIPESMRNAVIAAENASFYSDKGVDPMGVARAVVNMAKGGETQGGSTITQQYVKNTYLDQSQTLSRKTKELFISIKVGAKMDKDEILAGYLNSAYYGRNAYGIQAAAQAYFKVDAKDLSEEQSVFLACMLKGPNLYNPDGGVGNAANPDDNRKRAEARWKWILDREVEVGRMKPQERAKIVKFPKLEKQGSTLSGQTGYLIDVAKDYVIKTSDITAEQLERGGYRIYTTFNKKRVAQMEKAVQATKKDFLDPKKRPKTDDLVQFGGASVDPKTGAIVSLYGGDGYDKGHYINNANTKGVPVGSTWKPLVLAAAMEHGTVQSGEEGISPKSRYNGNDLIVIKDRNGDPIKGPDGEPFRQKNESAEPFGNVTLTKAMEKSINTPFVQLGIDVGLDKTRDLAKKTGILEESFDKGNLNNASFSLGTSTPSAIRMADSYATFANSGVHYEPYSVTKVIKDSKPLPEFDKPKSELAMDPNTADTVTEVLENVVQNGTGKKVKDIGFPVAGKTGTTDKNKSAWFVGYTRELSTAVTLFRTDPKEGKLLSMNGTGGVPSIHGGDIPAVIWKEFMAQAMKDVDVPEEFPEATDTGEVVGPVPSPTPTPTPSDTATESPSPTEEEPSPSETPDPTPTETCDPFDWNCGEDGGTDTGGGGDPGGADGGVTPTPSDTETDPGNGNGNGNGGLFGGNGG
ncbi:penicillin-binding protein [Streptomyces sp. NA04227]|uniref:transglycosylase domain-containing protein n=1 Tax=Streptomyces sp. NA04227 TaxID=2742136 RepID=UPI0015916842|nr:transglycosylase domain-containing protein [Streptomyces sp. NA04227]QKW07812.1 penicillin-binding protein [Streptomyces sp. NA04227]